MHGSAQPGDTPPQLLPQRSSNRPGATRGQLRRPSERSPVTLQRGGRVSLASYPLARCFVSESDRSGLTEVRQKRRTPEPFVRRSCTGSYSRSRRARPRQTSKLQTRQHSTGRSGLDNSSRLRAGQGLRWCCYPRGRQGFRSCGLSVSGQLRQGRRKTQATGRRTRQRVWWCDLVCPTFKAHIFSPRILKMLLPLLRLPVSAPAKRFSRLFLASWFRKRRREGSQQFTDSCGACRGVMRAAAPSCSHPQLACPYCST